MRVDPLSREEEAKVSLIEGDFYALLAGKSQRKNFELEVPEVETQINSTNFWVRRDDSGSKFTNYDERILQVSAQGESVDLGRNEATLVRSGAPPSDKIEILPPPALLAPQDDAVAFQYGGRARLVAGHRRRGLLGGGGIRSGLQAHGPKPVGRDRGPLRCGRPRHRCLLLAGRRARQVRPAGRAHRGLALLRADRCTPPYLSIGGPEEGAILRATPIRLQGESEPGAALQLNGEPVPIDPDGGFDLPYRPSPGLNTVTIAARDRAGNSTERQRAFVFMPDQQAAVAFDPAIPRLSADHFLTDREVISLAGRTDADARVVIAAADGTERASSFADPDGRFGVNLPLREPEERSTVQVTAPSGFVTEDEFQVSVDQAPPPIELESLPPLVTAVEWLSIEGDEAVQCDNTDIDEMRVRVVEAPAARVAGPSRVAVGALATFDASASSGATDRIRSWHWDFGDGSAAEGPVVEHTYQTPGPYVVRLSIRTDATAAACDMAEVKHQVVANAQPVAAAGEDRLVGVNQEVLFDGSASADPDGSIAAWLWDFGDGSSAEGVNARHRFREPGRYEVKLTVRDETDLPNNAATDSLFVEVNAPPEPVIVAPAVACVDEPVRFDATGSGSSDGGIQRFAWSFGDGASAEGPEVEHRYGAHGRFQVALLADDGRGLNNSQRQAVHRLHVNEPPRAFAGPDRVVCPGEPVIFDGAASHDGDGAPTRFSWDFADGASADGAQVTHVFETPGVYDVLLSVTDDSGASCGTTSDVARVWVNAPPIAVAGDDREGFVGGAYDQLLFDASASTDADGEPLSFLWDLGDGATRTGEKVQHACTEPGDYSVRLGVADGTGLSCGQTWDEIKVSVRRRE